MMHNQQATKAYTETQLEIKAELKKLQAGLDAHNAIQQLRAKIKDAEKLQTTMKIANRIVRKKITDGEKVIELVKIEGIDGGLARQLIEPGYPGPGFPSYRLTNNNANIKRMKARIATLQVDYIEKFKRNKL